MPLRAADRPAGTATAISAAGPAAVWAALLDGRRWSFWNPGVEWLWLEGEPVPGTLATIKLRRMRQTALVLREIAPEGRLVLGLTVGPIARLTVTWTLVPIGEQTRITCAIAVGGIAGPLVVGRAARRLAVALPGHVERLAAYAATQKDACGSSEPHA